MLNKYIILGTLCISSLIQSAATGTIVQSGGDSTKTEPLDLADCFESENVTAFGKKRIYRTFAVSKRLKEEPRLGLIRYKVSDAKDTCDLVMGCVGIVDFAADTAAPEDPRKVVTAPFVIASLIELFATDDTSWIPVTLKKPSAHLTPYIRDLEQTYLNSAIRHATQGSYEQYPSMQDVNVSFMWFQSSKDNGTFELSPNYAFESLRPVIKPSNVEKDMEMLTEWDPKNGNIEHYAEHAKSALHHDATILRLIPERMNTFLAQALGQNTEC